MLLGGLRDRTVEYTTWVWGFTKVAKSFYSNREFRSLNCSAVLIFRNPRKAMFGPESASRGVTGSYSWVYDMGMGRLYWFSVTPGKLCLPLEVLLGVLRDRTVEYTTWVWGFTQFAKSFYSNREFRSLNCSAVLIFRNPRKAMFAPGSASWGVTGSYSWVYDMGMGIQFAKSSIQTENFEA